MPICNNPMSLNSRWKQGESEDALITETLAGTCQSYHDKSVSWYNSDWDNTKPQTNANSPILALNSSCSRCFQRTLAIFHKCHSDIGQDWIRHKGHVEPKKLELSGCFLKWWVSPTTMGFPTENDHFGVFWGYHHLRKHPSDAPKNLQKTGRGEDQSCSDLLRDFNVRRLKRLVNYSFHPIMIQ